MFGLFDMLEFYFAQEVGTVGANHTILSRKRA